MNGFQDDSSAASSGEQGSAVQRLQEKEEEDASGAWLEGGQPAAASWLQCRPGTCRALCD